MYGRVSLDDLIRLRDHGVTLAYAEHVRERNGRTVSIDELIDRRDHGDRY
jgi:hypothetical protein